MEFFKTKFGAEACSYKGYMYRFMSKNATKKRWRCFDKTCNGKLWTNGSNGEPIVNGIHNHQADPDKAVVVEAISNMKSRATNELLPIPQIHIETG